VRFAVPETVVALITTVLTVTAAMLAGPQVAVVGVAGAPLLIVVTRWYLRRAPAGYLWERASYATLNGTVTETVEGVRTIEALGLAEGRVARWDTALREASCGAPGKGL